MSRFHNELVLCIVVISAGLIKSYTCCKCSNLDRWLVHISTHQYISIPIYFILYHCVSLCTTMYHYVLMCTDMYWFVLMCTDVYWCVPMCTDVSQCVPSYSNLEADCKGSCYLKITKSIIKIYMRWVKIGIRTILITKYFINNCALWKIKKLVLNSRV